ncbi:MAG: YkgJ family cysteine cluster protein [Saprospiraceae bacterium]|uniref:YkgJ family cysteine cluster protein n=1 Tax=Candidatus Defluviibacterium haderslevense TaxID=2981993 RepID=A0A9D7S9V8_9BACT|nr:YkgJ family cysteine cluster protein [Candidatus Defluviibacterium haderslevense]
MKEEFLKSWKSRSRENIKKYKIFLNRIDKAKAIRILPELHHEAFKKIDCLDCAACCKNYSPRFKQQDIKRIAKSLNMKERDFELTYLVSDEDHDFVLQSKPCPFLEKDNKCQIYDVRPSDCHRFPYTDEDVFIKQPALTLMNASFCPAVNEVLERLMEIK